MWSPTVSSDELYHYGVLGMRWVIRRYQNYEGTRKAAGKKHEAEKRKGLSDETKKNLKRAAIAGLVIGGVVAGGIIISQHPEIFDSVKSGHDFVNDFADKPIGEISGNPNITDQAKEISKELNLNLKTVETTPSQDALVGNPGWKENRNSPDFHEKWEYNCSHSVMNFVLRRKGLDTKATEMAFDESGGLSMAELCSYFKDAHPSKKIRLTANDSNSKTYEKIAKKYIADKLGGLEDGACGAIEVRGSMSGHFIAWCNDGGTIKIFNTQPGLDNADSVFERMANGNYSNDVKFVRLDNLELNYNKFKDRPFCENA